MKQLLKIQLLIFILPLISYGQYVGDQVFDNSFIHTIEIETEANISSLFDIYFDELFSAEKTYYLASLTFDGIVVDSVGIRVKGGISAFDDKKPFKIDFNEFVSGKKLDGVKKLNLHQGSMDRSFIREKLAYDLFRDSGVKTVRTSYAKLYYNGNYEGLYTIVEQVDDTFINELFADADGALYKTSFSGLDLKFQVDSVLTFEQFETRINQIPSENLHIELPKILDVESFNKFTAHEIFLGNNDGPLVVDVNYYLYYEPKSGKYSYVPWDYNLVLYGSKHSLLQQSSNFIFERVKENSVLLDRYTTTFCSLLDYHFREDKIIPMIESYESLIADTASEDPYFTNLNISEEVTFIKNLCLERINELRAELITINVECEPQISNLDYHDIAINEIVASNNASSGISDQDGGYPDWIELYNNTTTDIALHNMYLSNDLDFPKHWSFPDDLILEKNEYLIIWADRDLDEEGLHADFKLNKNRGELILCHRDGSILDKVEFREQETNIAYARVPNGNGQFVSQSSTFNDNNIVIIDNDNDGFDTTVDCDDSDPNINPSQTEIIYNGLDDDCNSLTLDDDLDQDGFTLAEDCNDTNPLINPDATDIPDNSIDEDCDGFDSTIIVDSDGDGFDNTIDCDDNNPNVNPNQTEEPYNGIDDDCNPSTLDDDIDQDGFVLADDCNDNNPNVNPNQTEEPYNGIDDDCNPSTLDDDLDQDGFLLVDDCDDNSVDINPDQVEQPYNGIDDDCNTSTLDDDLDEDGFVLTDDCDDDNPNINPDAEEIPNNGTDEDCDGFDLTSATYEIANSTVNIYPNPVVDIINIEVAGKLIFKASLYDLKGKLMTTTQNKNLISITSIPTGTYLLEIQDLRSGQKIVERIVIGR